MADHFITELDAITTFDDTDLVVIEKNPGGASASAVILVRKADNSSNYGPGAGRIMHSSGFCPV